MADSKEEELIPQGIKKFRNKIKKFGDFYSFMEDTFNETYKEKVDNV